MQSEMKTKGQQFPKPDVFPQLRIRKVTISSVPRNGVLDGTFGPFNCCGTRAGDCNTPILTESCSCQ